MDWKSPLFLIGPRRALPALPPLNLPNPLPRRCPLPVRSGTREHLLEHEMSLDSYIQTDPRSRNRHFSKRPKHPGRKPQAMRPPHPNSATVPAMTYRCRKVYLATVVSYHKPDGVSHGTS